MTLNSEYVFFGIENPLLDISAIVSPDLLKKYNLKPNDAILADESHKALFEELIRDYKVEYNAAGAAQNTMRAAQYMLPPKSTVFVGCVGNDKNAEILREVASSDGLHTEYLIDQELPTGRCAVLITGNNRSMVTDLLAANAYKPDHLSQPHVWTLVEQAKFFYVGGYFLTVSPPSALKLAEHALEKDKNFSLNLSAPFIPQFFTKPLDELIPYTDIVFGNESEAQSFADAHDFKSNDIKEIALKIANLPKKGPKSRIVVITQGALSTMVATDGIIKEYSIIPIKSSDIIDTTGAGDAFVGGFMAQFIKGAPLDKCVAAGHYLANIVIQRSGPTYPRVPSTFV